MKIYIHYEITDEPWGGINSFFKAFKNYLIEKRYREIEIITNIKDKYDIFLMGANYCGQGKKISYKEIKKVSEGKNRNWLWHMVSGQYNKCKIIHRVDGLRSIYTQNRSFSESDREQYYLLSLSDWAIFQSRYCLKMFKNHMDYAEKENSIIYNGVDKKIFNTNKKRFWEKKSKLKVLSTSWSSNKNKGFEVISIFSELEEVESIFIGNWCKEVEPRNVKIIPPLKQEILAEYYKSSDIFLYPSKNDFCPNVVLEALSSGLPVIYHNSGGTPEIAKKYGIPLPDLISKESLEETLDKVKRNYYLFQNYIEKDMKIFSIDYVAEKYLKLFEEVLNEGG